MRTIVSYHMAGRRLVGVRPVFAGCQLSNYPRESLADGEVMQTAAVHSDPDSDSDSDSDSADITVAGRWCWCRVIVVLIARVSSSPICCSLLALVTTLSVITSRGYKIQESRPGTTICRRFLSPV